MILVLDNLFVHRARGMEKDGNPLNEVRVLCNSLLTNKCVLLTDKTIKLDSAKSILGYGVGDDIALRETDFLRLSKAFFAEVGATFRSVSQR